MKHIHVTCAIIGKDGKVLDATKRGDELAADVSCPNLGEMAESGLPFYDI